MDETPETRDSLILRVQDPTDADAWAEFVAIYRPVVCRLARRRGLQHADAEDLAQQVFASVARAIDGWEPGPGRPPFRAWLFRIARNAILNALARRRPDAGSGSTSVQELLLQQPEDPELTVELAAEGRRQAFRWAAEQIRPEFSDATWSMFWQSAVLGRPVPEVATAHRRSPGAVYVARCRVLQRLKEKVREASGAWEDWP